MDKHPRILVILLVAILALLAATAGSWLPSPTTSLDDSAFQRTGSPGSTLALKPVASDGKTAASPGFKSPQPSRDTSPPPDPWMESLHQKLEKPNVVAGEALLTFKSKEDLDRFAQQAAAFGLQTLGTIPQLNAARVRYGTIQQLGDAITASGAGFANAEGNPWLSIPPVPPQPESSNQDGARAFGYNTLGAINAVGDRAQWGDNVTVAVVDSGVLDNPTFAPGQVSHVDLLDDGQPFNSHGTSVASLIGGQNPQAPGVAPGAQILDVRVANTEGDTVGSILADGIVTATDRGAQVINLSLGGYGDSTLLQQAVDYANQHGAVVVAAAGNDAYNQLAIPAAYPNVISVGSVDANFRQAYFSNSGQGLDLSAPGVGVITAWSTNQIALASGTSQSSALVSGAAAAYLGWGVSSDDLTARLKADSRPIGAPTSEVGAGVLMIRPPAGK